MGRRRRRTRREYMRFGRARPASESMIGCRPDTCDAETPRIAEKCVEGTISRDGALSLHCLRLDHSDLRLILFSQVIVSVV